MTWTPEAEARLRQGYADGRLYKQLAHDFGISPSAIGAKLRRMQLTKSGAPELGSRDRRMQLREIAREQQRLRS